MINKNMNHNANLDECALAKHKTTYPHDHPTENPKPPKRTRAEIQQAAKEKKEAELAKKVAMETQKRQKFLDAEEKQKLSAQRIASLEDAVQGSQKEHQSLSEHPDLKTMKMYQEQLQKKKVAKIEPIVNQEEVNELETDWDEMYIDPPVQLPPESMVHTNSDGARLGISEDEDDNVYKPADHKDDKEEGASGGDVSEDSMVQPNRETQKRWEKKKKEKGKLQAEVQAHCQVAPIVYAHLDPRLLDREKDEQRKKLNDFFVRLNGKATELGGLCGNWKQRAQVPSPFQPPPTTPATSSTASAHPQAPEKLSTGGRDQRPSPGSDGNDLDSDHGGEIDADKDEEVLAAVRKSKVKEALAEVMKYHKHGTKSMGIKLKTAEISAVKHQVSMHCPAKPCYKNGHLPFDNPTRDLATWRDAVLPAIIDWAGMLKEPFTVNSHPDLKDIVEDNWNEEFPEIPADDAVQAVASSAIRNWRSAIGKHALLRLTKNFATKPFKNSKNQHKEYVKKELKGLSYIYHDPVTKSGAYRSAALISTLPSPTHSEQVQAALKLWQTGDAPTKDIKNSFVRKPWAVRTAAHYKVVSTLSKRVWGEIHEALLSVIGSVEVNMTADDSEMEDPEDLVQLSSEPEDEAV
ncbi:hypothetical protein BYT27DRAFT_7264754 [Phlegmacium glaucopus]|nr:hypothetical protein BYT27DRAFT_7264754 [Phlegmacium glaucopus]